MPKEDMPVDLYLSEIMPKDSILFSNGEIKKVNRVYRDDDRIILKHPADSSYYCFKISNGRHYYGSTRVYAKRVVRREQE